MFGLFPKCSGCGGRIWPWQHAGWFVHKDRSVEIWHVGHRRPQ